ncbi:hypothetical protein K438DRAFT_1851171 [Mycena galopus ATCC 62051]|nr:hypothetical protein K438DRAFT_1851171 [Mycena galopus ATCC 62051]
MVVETQNEFMQYRKNLRTSAPDDGCELKLKGTCRCRSISNMSHSDCQCCAILHTASVTGVLNFGTSAAPSCAQY